MSVGEDYATRTPRFDELVNALVKETTLGCLVKEGKVPCANPACSGNFVTLPAALDLNDGFRLVPMRTLPPKLRALAALPSGPPAEGAMVLVAWCEQCATDLTPTLCSCHDGTSTYSYTEREEFLVQCDVCKEWYHGDCVGVADEPGIFACPSCLALQDRREVLDPAILARNQRKDVVSEEMSQARTFFARVETLRNRLLEVRELLAPLSEAEATALEAQLAPLNVSLQRHIAELADNEDDREAVRREWDAFRLPEVAEKEGEEEEDDDEMLVCNGETFPLSRYGARDVTRPVRDMLEQLLKDVDDWEDAAVDLVTRFKGRCKDDRHIAAGALRTDHVAEIRLVVAAVVKLLVRRPRKRVMPSRAKDVAIAGDEAKWLLNAAPLATGERPTVSDISGVTALAKSWNLEGLTEVSGLYGALVEKARAPAKWLRKHGALAEACVAQPAVTLVSDGRVPGDTLGPTELGSDARREDGSAWNYEEVTAAILDMPHLPVRVPEREALRARMMATQRWAESVDALAVAADKPGAPPVVETIRQLCVQPIIPFAAIRAARSSLAAWFVAQRWVAIADVAKAVRFPLAALQQLLDAGKSLLAQPPAALREAWATSSRLGAAYAALEKGVAALEAQLRAGAAPAPLAAAVAAMLREDALQPSGRSALRVALATLQGVSVISIEEEALAFLVQLETVDAGLADFAERSVSVEEIRSLEADLVDRQVRADALASALPAAAPVLARAKEHLGKHRGVVQERLHVASTLGVAADNALQHLQTVDGPDCSRSTVEALLRSLQEARVVLKASVQREIDGKLAGAGAWEASTKRLLATDAGLDGPAARARLGELEAQVAAAKLLPVDEATLATVTQAADLHRILLSEPDATAAQDLAQPRKAFVQRAIKGLQAAEKLRESRVVVMLQERFEHVLIVMVENLAEKVFDAALGKRQTVQALLNALGMAREAGIFGRVKSMRYWSNIRDLLAEVQAIKPIREELATIEASLSTHLLLDTGDRGGAASALRAAASTLQGIRDRLAAEPHKFVEEHRSEEALQAARYFVGLQALYVKLDAPAALGFRTPWGEVQRLVREFPPSPDRPTLPLLKAMGRLFPNLDYEAAKEPLAKLNREGDDFLATIRPVLVTRRRNEKRAVPPTPLADLEALLALPLLGKVHITEADELRQALEAIRLLGASARDLMTTGLRGTDDDEDFGDADISRLRERFTELGDKFTVRLVATPERGATMFLAGVLRELETTYESLVHFKERVEKGEGHGISRLGVDAGRTYADELTPYFANLDEHTRVALQAVGAAVEARSGPGGQTAWVISGDGDVLQCLATASQAYLLLLHALDTAEDWKRKAAHFLATMAASKLEKHIIDGTAAGLLKNEAALALEVPPKLTEPLQTLLTSASKSSDASTAASKASATAAISRLKVGKRALPPSKAATQRGKGMGPLERTNDFDRDPDDRVEVLVYYPCTKAGCGNQARKKSSFCGDACAWSRRDQTLDTLTRWWYEDGALFDDAPSNATNARDFNAPALQEALVDLEKAGLRTSSAEVAGLVEKVGAQLADVRGQAVSGKRTADGKRARVRSQLTPILLEGLSNASAAPTASRVMAWDLEEELHRSTALEGDDEGYDAGFRRLRYSLADGRRHARSQLVHGGQTTVNFVAKDASGLAALADYHTENVQKMKRKFREAKQKKADAKRPPKKPETATKRKRDVPAKEGRVPQVKRQKGLEIDVKAAQGERKRGGGAAARSPTARGMLSPKSPTEGRSPGSGGRSGEKPTFKAWSDQAEAQVDAEEGNRLADLERLPQPYAVEYKGYEPFDIHFYVANNELGAEDLLRSPLRLQGRVRLQAVQSFISEVRQIGNRKVYQVRMANVMNTANERRATVVHTMFTGAERCGVAEFDSKNITVYIVPKVHAKACGFRGVVGDYPWAGFVVAKMR